MASTRLRIIVAFPFVTGTASYLTITAGIAAVNRPSNHGCDGCARLTMPPSGCIVPAGSGCGISAHRRTLAQPGTFPPAAGPSLPPDGSPMSDSSVSAPHDRMANAIRALAMDAVQAAKSGHPGMPMGMADAATVLFTKFLKFDPQRPDWPDRDRFVLSAGHGSMLLYALLHLTGYPDMTMAEIRNFRQLHSRTAGAPGIWRSARNRDHDRASGTGVGQRRRHGAGRADDECALRRRSGRPPDLGRRRRRLPDGRHLPGSDHTGRPSPAREADRPVRR